MESGAHLLTLVVRGRQDDGYAVMWTEHVPGSTLEIRGEGRLVIDPQATLTSASAREYGVRLGQALFTGVTLEGWLQARARGRERLHVVLEIEAAELRTLRWERLCAPFGEAWDFLRCDQRTPFTMRVASQSDRAYTRPEEPRALVVVTSPSDLPDFGFTHFDTLAMLTGLRAALAPWPVDVLAFGVPGAVGLPTLEGLCDQLTERRYAVVHLVCHGAYAKGSGETVLYLADDDETTAPVPASKLLKRVGRLGGEVGLPSLWFFGSCSTAAPEAEGALGGLGSRLCRELGAPAVVAMADRVTVDTAMELVRPLYRQLRAHGHVDLALGEACSAVAERLDLVVPVLYARSAGEPLFSGTGPEGQVKAPVLAEEGRLFSETPIAPALGERFVGRIAVLAELSKRLGEGRPQAALLVGAAGFGKTRAALEFVWSQRARFPGGVFWIDAQAPARREASHHVLLKQLQPGTPPLAELQAKGLDVAALLADAARAHRPGQRQLWVLDHVPEREPGTGGRSLAELCPRWGEVAVLATSRMRPDEPGIAVIELAELADAEGGVLLTSGLPDGSMTERDAAAVVRWVGGLPLALELLARSLDLGDLSPAELVAMARTQGVARALDETHQVLRQAGVGTGLIGVVETMRLSYERLSPEAQALARRLAQFGPEPLPTALVKGLGPVSTRLARATLAGRSFVTGISGEMFGCMHRVLADYLRGLASVDERNDAVAALLGLLPPAGQWLAPGEWPAIAAVVVHAQALVLRTTCATGEIVELGNRVGVLLGRQGRIPEAAALQRHVLALAAVSLPPEDRRCVIAAGNLGMTLLTQGFVAEGRRLIGDATALAERTFGPRDALTLAIRSNYAMVLLLADDRAAAMALMTELAAQMEEVRGRDSWELLTVLGNLAAALWQVPDLARARALQEQVLAGWRRQSGAAKVAAMMASAALAQTMQMQGDLVAARAQIEEAVATATREYGAEDPTTLDLREKRASILRDQGELTAARAEQTQIVAALTRYFGADSPITILSQILLAVILREVGGILESRALLTSMLDPVRRFGAGHPLVLRIVIELCTTLRSLGDVLAAKALLVAELPGLRAAHKPHQREILELEQNLAGVLIDLHDLAAAGELLRRLISDLATLPPDYNPVRLACTDALVRFHMVRGEFAEARATQERALADSRAIGAPPRDILLRTFTLAQTLRAAGDLVGARALQVEALTGMRQLFGLRDPQTVVQQVELGTTMVELGELVEAEALLVPALAVLGELMPPEHPANVFGRAALVRVHLIRGQLVAAQTILLALLPHLGPMHGGFQHEAVNGAVELAERLCAGGQASLAVPLLQRASELMTRLAAPDDVRLLSVQVNLAAVLFRAGDRAAALALLGEVGERIAPGGAQHPLAAAVAHNRARILQG